MRTGVSVGNSPSIIHLDLDAFFCAVEEQREPALRGKAFAVGGRPEARGVVSSCSYAARQFGVRSAMPMARALRLCPGLVIISPHYQAYTAASRQVMDCLHNLTTLVEQISIDEAFMDVSGFTEPVERIACRLQAAIRDELGLPCSIGVASNKLVAKIATEVGKAARRGSGPPNALTVVSPGTEAAFLAPLPVAMLWGVGPKTAGRLAELGIQTIGDLAVLPEMDLARRFGKHGLEMARYARGIDHSPIVTSHTAKSISQETTYARDVSDEPELRATLRSLSHQVAERLQKNHLSGMTVKLKLRWPDFTTLTRQATLDKPTDQGELIFRTAEQLFDKVWSRGKPVRLLGVGVTGLDPRPRQLSLWEVGSERDHRLQAAIVELQARYGKDVLTRGIVKRTDDE